MKGGSQTGATLNDPGAAGEALIEIGSQGKRSLGAVRAFALMRFHKGTPDDGNDDNESFGAGFGAALVGGTTVLRSIDVHAGLGYVAWGFSGPRALVGATLWPFETGSGGGYAVNVELDFYRGTRASNELRDYSANHHVALTLGLELWLGKHGGQVYRRR